MGHLSLLNMKCLGANILAILFLFGGLFPGTDLEEAFKIPALLVHYEDHHEQDHISVIEFFNQHYGHQKGEHHDKDHDGLPMLKHQAPFVGF